MQKEDIKPYLIERLKQVNAFWSYNVDTIKDVPDSILVELVFLHLDLDDIEFDRWDADTLVCKATGAEPVAFNLEGKCRIRFI